MGLELYHPEKYAVIQGDGSHIGFCTCWTEPERLAKQHHDLREHCAILSSLYSREGVSVILRNLLLNPQITDVFVWANHPLSKTEFGKRGHELLTTLWKNGANEENLVVGTDCRVHKEIDQLAINILRSSVKLHDVSDMTIEEILEMMKESKYEKGTPRKKPLSFQDPVRDESATMPSEKVGWVVRGNTVADAWLSVVDRITRYGSVKTTEYGNKQKELQNITWVIENEDPDHPQIPDWHEKVLKMISFDDLAIQGYRHTFLDSHLPKGVSYTYGQRLLDYPAGNVNQIKEMIKRLKSADTRRAVATTLYPPEDAEGSSPPCLNFIQVIADDQVNLFATFRSHDIFKAAIPNAFGLLGLLDFIADECGKKPGVVAITSNSAHIYEEEWKDAEDLVKCKVWARPRVTFDEKTDIDPRGLVRITVKDNKIEASLLSPDGEVLYECIATTAREIIMKFVRLDLLSKSDHYCDVTMELLKAEVAMKSGIPYVQDRAIQLPNGSVR